MSEKGASLLSADEDPEVTLQEMEAEIEEYSRELGLKRAEEKKIAAEKRRLADERRAKREG